MKRAGKLPVWRLSRSFILSSYLLEDDMSFFNSETHPHISGIADGYTSIALSIGITITTDSYPAYICCTIANVGDRERN